MQKEPESKPRRKPFPWILLLLLLATLYGFWILPLHMGERPVEVEFQPIPQAPASDSP